MKLKDILPWIFNVRAIASLINCNAKYCKCVGIAETMKPQSYDRRSLIFNLNQVD
ncbi:MAG: hypothetical protein V7K89_25020 [Nostoc sp.]|uniref:hypothetical protein n=1 Tax=Nostoc sp. TaxID=1180 RepID=UPI002FFD4C0C